MVSPSIEPGKDPGKAKITGTVQAKPGQLAAMMKTTTTMISASSWNMVSAYVAIVASTFIVPLTDVEYIS